MYKLKLSQGFCFTCIEKIALIFWQRINVIQLILFLEHLMQHIGTGKVKTTLPIVQIGAGKETIPLKHLRMLQVFIKWHPTDSLNFPIATIYVEILGF